MSQILTFVSMLGGAIGVVWLCTGAWVWLRDGVGGLKFLLTWDYQLAKNSWEARCLEEDEAKARTPAGVEK